MNATPHSHNRLCSCHKQGQCNFVRALSAIPTKNLWYPLILMSRSGHLGQHFLKCLNDLETKLWYNKAGEMLGEFLPWIRNWRLPRSFHKVHQPHKLVRILCVTSSTSFLPCKKPQGFFSSLSSWPEWLELPLEKDSLQIMAWALRHRGAKPLISWNPLATSENATSDAKSLQNHFKTYPECLALKLELQWSLWLWAYKQKHWITLV